MAPLLRVLRDSVAAAVAAGALCGVHAQGIAANVQDDAARSGQSFVGIAVGKPHYGTSCGNVAGLSCSNNATSYTLTAGNMFTRNVGVELAFLDFGNADRAGGSVSARGLNASAVGHLPLGDSLAFEGRIGPTYGITRIRAPAYSGIPTGRGRGVGLGLGVALDVDIVRGLQGSLGWEQHDFHFAGQGTSNVRNVSVSLGYEF